MDNSWRMSSLGLLLTMLAACAPPLPESNPSTTESVAGSASPNLTYQNITLTESQPNGRILWKVSAQQATYDNEGVSASLETVAGEFYDPQNRAITMLADRGSVYPLDKRLELTGSVRVLSAHDQVEVQADRVEWLPEENLLTATGQVILQQNLQAEGSASRWQLQSDRLTVNFADQQITLANSSGEPVRGSVSQPNLQVAATTVGFDLAQQSLQAQGSVEIVDPEQQLNLQGDRMTSPWPPQQIVVTGNVVGRSDKSQLRVEAGQMTWQVGSTVVEAQGNVAYQQPNQNLSVRGSSATINWQANTVAVRGGSTTQLNLP
ncbi:MAG: LPS export ABC transporter periplasmic protein LptC [Cyanobacteriota bacterium]|nr:LPS export ABC transporter periplasmic protein LptC [Cyanobacteriota bacterium]